MLIVANILCYMKIII